MECIVDLRVSGLDNTTTTIAWCLDTDNETAINTSGWTLTPLGDDEGRYTLDVPNATEGSTVEIYQTANRANYAISSLSRAALATSTSPIVSTVATPLTIADLIQDALETLGVHDPQEALSAEEGNTGLRKLNLLMDELSLDKSKIFRLTEETFVLVIGTGSYTMGPGLTWDAVLPVDIVQAYLRDTTVTPNYDFAIRVNMTQAEYNAMANKSQSNRPTAIFFAPGSATSRTVYFDTLPDKAYTAHIFSQKPFTEIGAITDSLSLPPGYQAYLTAALTVALAPLFSRAVPEVAARTLNKMEKAIDAQNGSQPPTWNDMTQPSTMNWSRGGGSSFPSGGRRF